MTEATKAPAPWDNPGIPPTDLAAQQAAEAAEQARQAAIAAAGTQGTTPAVIGAASPDSSAASGTAAPEVTQEVTVTAIVPRAFTLRLSTTDGKNVSHFEFPYKAGTQQMPLDHATHWWSVKNGVKVYDPTAKP